MFSCCFYKGKSNSVMNRLAAHIIMFIGIPIRAKSEKRYPPGPYTIIWVGDPIGVAKLDDTDIINAMQNVRGFTSRFMAVW